jgi:hypothetical protein
MTTYAQVHNGVVVNIIVADISFITTLPNAAEFHLYDDSRPAGIGWLWDDENHRAIPPQPYPSWVRSGWGWAAPVAKPEGDYYWNEDTQSWVER